MIKPKYLEFSIFNNMNDITQISEKNLEGKFYYFFNKYTHMNMHYLKNDNI